MTNNKVTRLLSIFIVQRTKTKIDRVVYRILQWKFLGTRPENELRWISSVVGELRTNRFIYHDVALYYIVHFIPMEPSLLNGLHRGLLRYPSFIPRVKEYTRYSILHTVRRGPSRYACGSPLVRERRVIVCKDYTRIPWQKLKTMTLGNTNAWRYPEYGL